MDLFVLILLSSFLIFFTATTLIFYFKYKKFIRVIAQLIVDNQVLKDKLNESMSLNSKEFSDGFIKFLSESREAAFKYIEDVQVSIKNYLNAINANDKDQIAIAQLDLFSYLPDTNDKQKELPKND
jgi:predicted PurR-regulated permease PerM